MPENTDEAMSLRELILKMKEWVSYLLSKWLVIILIAVLGGLVGLLYAINKKPLYTGKLVFVLSSDSKNASGFAGLAGQFGLDIGGGSNNGAFEGENIVELLKSRTIVKGALFKPVAGNKLLINLIGEKYLFFKGWKKAERLKKLIPFPADMSKINPLQDSLISAMHEHIVKVFLDISKPDKKLSFYSVKSISTDEIISSNLTKNLVTEAAKMYINTKTKSAKDNLEMLQHEADSLRAKLGMTIYSTASTVDQTFNLNSALQTQRASIQQNQIQAQVLGAAYTEVVKNLEIAKINLLKETPLFQIIDEPILPLKVEKLGKLKGLVIGAFVAGFLACIMLIMRKIYKGI